MVYSNRCKIIIIMIIIASLSMVQSYQDNKIASSLKGNNNNGLVKHKHLNGVELLDRHDAVDRLLAFFEDPRTDLTVGKQTNVDQEPN